MLFVQKIEQIDLKITQIIYYIIYLLNVKLDAKLVVVKVVIKATFGKRNRTVRVSKTSAKCP